MKNMSKWAAIALMMATAMAGCDNSNRDEGAEPEICPTVPTTIELTPAEQQLVGGSNDFAFNLFREARHVTRSQVMSPVSITYALGMLNNGAAGETQKQINNVLGFGDTGADGINDFCYKMLLRASTLDEQTKVMIANTIYMNMDYGCELKPDFKGMAKLFYNADPESRSFSDGKTRDVINQWASDHTEQMIKEVLTKDEFDPTYISYLLNAIYFKGTWTTKFDKKETREEKFDHIGLTADYITRPMMHLASKFVYAENDVYRALRLPYGNGSYQMTVLLPRKKDNLDGIMQSLTAASWQQLQQQMDTVVADVKLPRFESDLDMDLIPVMKKLGMTKAFTMEAEFPNFCNTAVCIAQMKQVAKIKLDEEGTEASAVTVIGMVKSSGNNGPKEIIFHANQPFIYIISEQATDAVLFIGQYTGYL